MIPPGVMTRVNVPFNPTTGEYRDENDVVRHTLVASQAWLEPNAQFGPTVMLEGGGESRSVILKQITAGADGMSALEGQIDTGWTFRAREYDPDDAIVAGFSQIPLPAEVMGAILIGMNMSTSLEALVDSNGLVATMMLVSDNAMWLRYSGAWVKLVDLADIGQYEPVEVAPESLTIYDAADQSGQMLEVKSLKGPYPEDEALIGELINYMPTTSEEGYLVPPEQAVLMSSAEQTIELPVIDDVRGAIRAIEAAAADESIRWYVERRVKNLGLEVEIPWR